MTAVVGTLLNAWCIPRMNVHCVRPSVLEGNTGSLRVFEKNGFVLEKTVADCTQMVAKGELPERLCSVHLCEWRRR
jgi:RimJ/RimL family protein N-acetyltransferase